MIDLPASMLVAAFANNALLSHAFGAEHLASEHSMRRALAVTATLGCTAVPATLLASLLSNPAFGVDRSIGLFVLIVACAAIGLVVRHLLQRLLPRITAPLAETRPVLLLDSIVLALAIAHLHADSGLLRGIATTLATVGGFGLVLVLLAAMRERLRGADIPAAFRGTPIELVTLALMSLAFLGLAGIGQPG